MADEYETNIDWVYVWTNVFKFLPHEQDSDQLGRVSRNPDVILSFTILQQYDVQILWSDLIQLYRPRKIINKSGYASWTDLLDQRLLIEDPSEKDDILRQAIKQGYSIDFIDQVLLYRSGRPKQDLSKITGVRYNNVTKLVRTMNEVLVKGLEFPSYIIDLKDTSTHNVRNQQTLYFPVARYQGGMSSGLYYSEAHTIENKFCGTFYYFEPDSPYILQSNSTLVARNKVSACLLLGFTLDQILDTYINYILELGDRTRSIDENLSAWIEINFDVINVSDPKAYVIHHLALLSSSTSMSLKHNALNYAFEDPLDQLLCSTARQHNYDTVVLKYMTGRSRVVTEILDTRSRKESFANILYPPPLVYQP